MPLYRITPTKSVPCLRWQANTTSATARALKEFPDGLRCPVEVLEPAQVQALMRSKVPVPVSARRQVEAMQAAERVREKERREAPQRRVRIAAALAREKVREERRQQAQRERDEARAERQRAKRRAAWEERKALAAAALQEVGEPSAAAVAADVAPWD